jgi:hypothetical protein
MRKVILPGIDVPSPDGVTVIVTVVPLYGAALNEGAVSAVFSWTSRIVTIIVCTCELPFASVRLK